MWVHVDGAAAGQSVGYTIVVADPASYPAYYLGASTGTVSYIINKDETGGWYYAVNGTTGAIVEEFTSINASYTGNEAINSANGGSVFVCDGDYWLDQLSWWIGT